jgi:hypothetical protein
MSRNNAAANVIDLAAFRQRKMREEERASPTTVTAMESSPALVVPVWFCWVPMWTPFVG